MSNIIKDFKVNVLPTRGEADSRYYVPIGIDSVKEYVTDKTGKYRLVSGGSSGGILSVENFVPKEQPIGLIDGINNSFTLQNNLVPLTEHVYVNGVLQEEGDDYEVSGNIIIFYNESNPQTNFKLRISYFKQ